MLVIAFAYLAFTVLAPWQLGKNEQTSAQNNQVKTALATAPAPYEQLTSQGVIQGENTWKRAILTGHYEPDLQVVLRMRPVNSTPAYHALTVFTTTSGQNVLINRGFVPANANAFPEIAAAPSGEQTIIVYLRANEPVPATAPATENGIWQVNGINTEQIGAVLGTRLATDYGQLASDQAGVLNAIPLPQLESGPYLSYGIQWIAFGILAPLALLYFIWQEIKERRKAAAEQAQLAAATTNEETAAPTQVAPAPAAAAPAEPAPAAAPKVSYDRTRSKQRSYWARRDEERF